MNRGRTHLNCERGASAVEFALVLPLLVLLVFGIAQFGIAFFRYQGVQAAAREGARVASLSQTEISEIRDRVCTGYDSGTGLCSGGALSGIRLATEPTVQVDPNVARPCNLRSGEVVAVTVASPMAISIPLWGDVPVPLESRGEFRCE
jgi:Flp pilus assembly protein TadG